VGEVVGIPRPNTGSNTEVAKLQVFDGSSEKVSGFVTAYKLDIRIKMREKAIKEQIQWILLYVQGGSADVWKENILEDLEARELEYTMMGEFLAEIKREFRGENKKTVKIAELRRIEQGGKTMEEFVQEFRRAARGSEYKGHPLIKEFKREINSTIRRRLVEAKRQPTSIEQLYKRVVNLDRN